MSFENKLIFCCVPQCLQDKGKERSQLEIEAARINQNLRRIGIMRDDVQKGRKRCFGTINSTVWNVDPEVLFFNKNMIALNMEG